MDQQLGGLSAAGAGAVADVPRQDAGDAEGGARAGRLQFFGPHADLADKAAFKAWLEPLYDTKWHVYAKRPFAGPEQVLAYLARYTHRVAISNSRLIDADENGVTFRYKDYRIEGPAATRP